MDISYLVRAEIEKPGTGAFKTEAETERDAIEKAKELRAIGFLVQITDLTGRPVDETNELT